MFRNALFRNRLLNVAIVTVAIIYALIMAKLLFVRGHGDSYNYNLIPLKTIKLYINNRQYFDDETWIKNLFGNIVLFIPLGVIIPVLNRKFLKTLLFIVFIILILFSVEFIQLLTKVGSFDIDDIILNTLGAMIGFTFTKRLVSR